MSQENSVDRLTKSKNQNEILYSLTKGLASARAESTEISSNPEIIEQSPHISPREREKSLRMALRTNKGGRISFNANDVTRVIKEKVPRKRR